MQSTAKSHSDAQAERALLCSILLNPKCFEEVEISVEDFTKPEHQQIWLAIGRLAAEKCKIDTISVCKELERVQMLEMIGDGNKARGEDFVDNILAETTTWHLFQEHATQVRSNGIMQRFADAGKGLTRMASNGSSTEEVLAFAKQIVTMAEAVPWKFDQEVISMSADRFEAEPYVWLWENQLARGKMQVIAGDGGLGKSCVTLDLAARVTTGRPFPCENASLGRAPGSVILLSAEDDIEDTIVPRFEVAEGNPSKLHIVTGIRSKKKLRFVNLLTDLEAIEKVILGIKDVQLVIIDPITAYMGSAIKDGNNTEIRSALAPIKEMSCKHNVATILVTHFRKGVGRAVERIIGSIAFTAAARSCFVVTPDKDDPDRRLFINAKTNIGKKDGGFAYRIEIAETSVGPRPKVVWEDQHITMSADDAVDSDGCSRGRKPIERDLAKDYLLKALAAGPAPSINVIEDRPECVSERTLKRAKSELNIVSTRTNRIWVWTLPGSGPVMNQQSHEPTTDAPF